MKKLWSGRAQAETESFWDHNHHVSRNPDFWMAHPFCRAAINRRVCGDPFIWPFEAFGLAFVRGPRARALSLGCGTGELERAARQMKMTVEIDAVDASETSLQIARKKAHEGGLEGIEYRRADLNEATFPRRHYDLAFFHQSLHHVTSIEKLLARVSRSLVANGLLYLEEWTGPSRDEWDDSRLARAGDLFARLPPEWRRWPTLRAPVEVNDPSEAIRSSAILPAVRRCLRVIVERPYGGHLVSVILPQLARERIPRAQLDDLVARWLVIEDEDLARDPACSFHTALVARPRTGVGGFLSRLGAVPREASERE